MPRRYGNEQIRAIMVQEITKVLYPVLIPIEQQCVQTQTENRKQIEYIANQVWTMFIDLKEDLGRIK